MKTWDAFFRDLLPLVPGCPEPMAEHALMRATQTFLRGTRIWMADLLPFDTVPGLVEYDIYLEPGTELVRLESATFDGREFDVARDSDIRADWRDRPTGMSDSVFTPDLKTLIVLPSRDESHAIAIKAVLTVSDDAEGVEDFIFDHHAKYIAKGAAGDLMQQPQKPYTNPNQGMQLERQFRSYMTNVGLRRSSGYTSSRLTSRRSRNF